MYALKVVVECLKDRVKVPCTVFHAVAHTSQGAVNATGWRRLLSRSVFLAASRRTLESFLFFYFFIASDLEARQFGLVGGGRDRIVGGVLERPAHRHSNG